MSSAVKLRCGRTGPRDFDVLTALRYQAAVLTSDPDDLQRLTAATKIRLRRHQV
ncbi:MAG: hypothetical protein ACRDTH_14390 [Pseudonocardiaceae bacterium]